MKRNKYNVEHKRKKRKDEIVLAAVSLFTEKGFDRVSLSDIAARVHLGRTTIYEYFRNKNEILSSYLEREMNAYHEKVMAVMSRRTGFREKLGEFIALQLEYGRHHGGFSQLFRTLARHSEDISRMTEKMIRGKHQEIYGALTDEFARALSRKEIRPVSPVLIMQLLINATSFPLRGTADSAQTAEEVLSVFWHGIEKPVTSSRRK